MIFIDIDKKRSLEYLSLLNDWMVNLFFQRLEYTKSYGIWFSHSGVSSAAVKIVKAVLFGKIREISQTRQLETLETFGELTVS